MPRNSSARLLRWQQYALITSLLLMLSACQSISLPGLMTPPTPATTLDPQEALQQAQAALPSGRAAWQLRAAELYLAADQTQQALNVSDAINQALLTATEADQLRRIRDEISLRSGSGQVSETTLMTLPEARFLELTPDQLADALRLQSESRLLRGETESAIALLLRYAKLAATEQQSQLFDSAWQAIRAMPPEQLRAFQATATESELLVWLSLAELLQNEEDLDTQQALLRDWLDQEAPPETDSVLPVELASLRLLDQVQGKVAVLLPLSGRMQVAGQAIRDGFIAAYLEQGGDPSQLPEIHIFDSQSISNLGDWYRSLQDKGFGFVVGPLSKSNAEQIARFATHPVPVLALNYIDATPSSTAGFFQFGLAPEDEIRQIIDWLKQENHQRVVILSSDRSRSRRLEEYFREQAPAAEIDVLAAADLVDARSLSSALPAALGISASQERINRMAQLMGELRAVALPRPDLDAALVLTQPELIPQISPMMSFYYAADLPLYGTSELRSALDGLRNPSDMNGLQLVDMPWMFAGTPLAEESNQRYAGTLARLFALGFDAYQILPRLSLMRAAPTQDFPGQTGTLRVAEDGSIARTLQRGVIRNGEVVPLYP